jgi:hypothetical protein
VLVDLTNAMIDPSPDQWPTAAQLVEVAKAACEEV